jgi:hypothetical protein
MLPDGAWQGDGEKPQFQATKAACALGRNGYRKIVHMHDFSVAWKVALALEPERSFITLSNQAACSS